MTATKPPTFDQACRKMPRSLHPVNDDSETLDDLYHRSIHEITLYDEDQDGHEIQTARQRAAAQKYVDWLKPFVDPVLWA